MIALLTTVDVVKLSAVKALLAAEEIPCATFDAAAGDIWKAVIPVRLMVAEADAARARELLRAAGFAPAADGDWDFAPPPADATDVPAA